MSHLRHWMKIQTGYGNVFQVMDILEKVRHRHAELKATIDAADAMRPEYERLSTFLRQAEEIERQFRIPLNVVESSVGQRMKVFGGDGEHTSDMIEKILNNHGPRLHVKQIQDLLYRGGWKGSGDRHKDYKNVYQNISDKPKRFRKLAMATFEPVSESEKNEHGR